MPSSLKLKTSTPILKDQQTKLFTLWQSLQDHNDSLFFRTPVDKNAFPDYHLYVKHPMDLSTIQRRLREGKYLSVEEVLDDIQMIWDNCRRYNPTGTWIYDISITMERNFKKMVRHFLPHVPIVPLPASTSFPPPSSISFPPPAKSQEKPPGIIDEDDIFPWEEVSFQEKYTFVARVQLLPPHSLKLLIETIVELAPKAFVEGEGGKAQFIVDYIDALTFPIVREKLQELLVTHRTSTKKVKPL